ncbi:FAD/NAD(P)-binding oxidoreductase [Herminiimonas sp. CN]|uniref:NAD(P)/FAD-dependent oxidoreductase n=1 Tax=Herminiimonas sp. CN TaxID=1349818 RepID=UPI000473CCE4|nr:FAD/NAD(P)-binding oxidoreductase [Herminiimonas sp. CN]
MKQQFEIVIIGAGPAGLAAAHAVAASGAAIAVIDDNPHAGGQIWRGGPQHSSDARAAQLWSALSQANNVRFFNGAKVLLPSAPGALLVETPDAAFTLGYRKLILATGARERLLPFPGWTLPGVTGAGGIQALAKGGYPVAGKRIVVAGSGPLLLAVAATLKQRGAQVLAIVEQAPLHQVARFALALPATPAKLLQALRLRAELAGIPYHMHSHVLRAEGDEHLTQVLLQIGAKQQSIACDYLACGFGLLPNTETAGALGCTIADGAVQVDRWQQTSVADVYCAGEGTGIGGVDLALAEGRIAGLAAVGDLAQAARHVAGRRRWQGFAARLARAFALREELRQLADPDTIVCRCEDVRHRDLQQHASWRSAKLHTRCGMGPCQGRICGGATDFLYGWSQDSVRVPLTPARIGSLIAADSQE